MQQLARLVTRSEHVLYAILVILNTLIYMGIIVAAISSVEFLTGAITYGGLIGLLIFMTHGYAIGHLRGSGVKVGSGQFPKLEELAKMHAQRFNVANVPNVFVLQSGGILNAFATRFLGKNYVVINSEVLALAEERGEQAVSFIVAHEMAHVARGHLKHRWLITPAKFIPYLGSAYSRACEYTCDRFAAHAEPDGAVDGLMVLAAGRDLYRSVDAAKFAAQAESEAGFWMKRAESMSSHPHLCNRVAALLSAGLTSATQRVKLDGVAA